ncbi:MAG: nucleotidyltransferase domain-containing protein [Planctomycetaceae bacterium]|jgi:predicted nucleotidyltransferase|nr:nucleotidyltransferase domain-containing protein [Planctomycetaceae bacterium]
MLIREKDRQALLQIFESADEPIEVLAYGSRINGNAHNGSDLDLAVRRFDKKPLSTKTMTMLINKIQESNIPILIDLHDWTSLPLNFHNQIEKKHEIFYSQSKPLNENLS